MQRWQDDGMSLLDHAIWWHVYPLGFVGASIRPTADHLNELARPDQAPTPGSLISWLDYAVGLGANGLQLGPVFASTSHGYDTVDHLRIDPRLGGEEMFDALVAACQQRGVLLMLDGVFNHVGAQHPLVRRALAEGPDGELAGLFRLDWTPEGGRPAGWEGFTDLVEFNHDDPRAVDLVVEVMEHWLARGISGWRLDVAYAVPLAFWRAVTDRVRAAYPSAVFVGEVIHGDYRAFVSEGGLDSVTEYELWKAIWSSLIDHNPWEIGHTLERHDALLQSFIPMTFVGNHDVTRIATKVGDAGAVVALVLLMTVGGTPSLYYGDEQAFRGEKTERLGGDDEVRPAFPAAPDALAAEGWWMYRTHRELIALRRRHSWLQRARTSVVNKEGSLITYVSTGVGETEQVTVVLDLGEQPSAVVTDHAGVEIFRFPSAP
jgi:cyclomaltodextrinase